MRRPMGMKLRMKQNSGCLVVVLVPVVVVVLLIISVF
jgi:hypothetical protein